MEIIPKQIARSANHTLTIDWSDGAQTSYPFIDLRAACPCALCVDEWTREKRIQKNMINSNIDIKDIKIVGHYAIQIIWSDGHNTGIYTFKLLKEIASSA